MTVNSTSALQNSDYRAALNAFITATSEVGDDLRVFLEVALDQALRSLGLEMGLVSLRLETEMEATFVLRGLPHEMAIIMSRVGTTEQLNHGHVLAVSDWRNSVHLHAVAESIQGYGVRATIYAPIVAQSRPLGGLSVHAAQSRDWSEEEIGLIEAIARQLGAAVERSHLFQETNAPAEQLALLYDAGLTLNQVLDPHAQLEALARIALKALRADNATFFAYNPAENELRFDFSVGPGAAQVQAKFNPLVFPMNEESGLFARVGRTRKSLNVADVLADQCWRQTGLQVRSVLCEPVERDGQLLGLLAVMSPRLGAFSSGDERLLNLFANQAAVAIVNSRLLQRSKRLAEQLTLVNQFAQEFLQLAEPERLLSLAANRIIEQWHYYSCQVFLVEEDHLVFSAGKGDYIGPLPMGYELRYGQGIIGYVVQTRQPALVPDVSIDPRYLPFDGLPETRTELAVPITRGERLLGVLDIQDRVPGTLEDTDFQVLQAIATELGIALENARLFLETQQRTERLALLNRIARALGGTLNLDELLEIVYRELSTVMHADAFFVALYDGSTTELDFRIRVDRGVREPVQRRLMKPGLTSIVVHSQKPLLIRNFEQEKEHLPVAKLWGTMEAPASWLGVPMLRGDKLVGVISVQAYRPDAYGESELELLSTIADTVAVAVEDARLFEETRRLALEQSTVSEIARALNAEMDVCAAFPTVVKGLQALTNCERVSLTLLDEAKEHFTVIALDEPRTALGAGTRLPVTATSSAADILAGRIHFSPQLSAELDYPAEQALYEAGEHSRVNLPLITGDKVIGALNLASPQLDAFAPSQFPVLKQIAAAVATAVEKASLFEAEQTRRQELAALYDLSRALADLNDLDAILNLVAQDATASIHVSFTRLMLREGDTFVIRAAYPIRVLDRELELGRRVPVAEQTLCRHALEHDAPLIIRAESADVSDIEREFLFLGIAKTLCLVPLRLGDHPRGLILLAEARSEEREPFTAEKIHLARSLGEQAAGAIHRAMLSEQTERRLRRLDSLRAIDKGITSSLDLEITLAILLDQVTAQLGVDAADVLLLNPHAQTLEFAAGRGFRRGGPVHCKLRLGHGIESRAIREGCLVSVNNLVETEETWTQRAWLAEEGFVSYYAVPLVAKAQERGILEIFHRKPLAPDEEWLGFLETLAGQAAIAINNAELFAGLHRSHLDLAVAYDATIEGWSRALDLRDKETEGHTQRVTELTISLGRAFGLSEEELSHVRRGALLHDIGKMGIPDAILLKPGPLTPSEWDVMRKHPVYAYELLSGISYLRPALNIPYYHHEKWDGTGYPHGHQGEQIPLVARIFAVVDVWDALSSDRPYRKAWPPGKVSDYIREQAGEHFDPVVVEKFLKTIASLDH